MLLTCLSAMKPVMGADALVTLSVSLVCGTDKPSPSFQYAGPVHQELQDKFTKIFKWEHYFLLTKKELAFHASEVAKATLQELQIWFDNDCFRKALLKSGDSRRTS